MRRVLRPLLLATAVAVLSAQVVAAAKPIHERFAVDATYAEELCGLTVTTHDETNVNVLIFEDRLVDLSRVRITWTNDEGDWLELLIAGPVTITEEWNGDILTVIAHNAGLHHRLRSSAGIDPRTFDRGQITFKDVIDFSDPEEPIFVTRDILFEAGPHPLAHSTTDVFCEAVVEALG
jgi:hypothetical protein